MDAPVPGGAGGLGFLARRHHVIVLLAFGTLGKGSAVDTEDIEHMKESKKHLGTCSTLILTTKRIGDSR